MTKRCCVLLIIFFSSGIFRSKAQDSKLYLGVKGGISIPNLTARGANNPLNIGYSSRLGPDAAILAEKPVSNTFSVAANIEYSSEGGKKKGFQPFPFPTAYAALYAQLFPTQQVPTYLYADFKNEVELNYLMLSVLAKFNRQLGATSPVMFYAEVGPFGAYLLSAKDVTSGLSIVYADEQKQQPLIATPISFDNKMDEKAEVHKGNFGVAGDIGFAYNFPTSRLFMEAGGNYGLLNIQKNAANGKNQIGAVIGRIGYTISFGSRD